MTNSTTTTNVSATATSVTPAQKRAITKQQVVTPMELAPVLKFPLYAFTAQGKATKGAKVFGKHHHFCHLGFEDFKVVVQQYRINNIMLARMMEGVGATSSMEGFVFVSYDQQIGQPNPYKTKAPYRKAMYDFLRTLSLSTVIVSDNHLVLEVAANRGHKVLHRTVETARKNNIHHVSVLRGTSTNGLSALKTMFYGVQSSIVTY